MAINRYTQPMQSQYIPTMPNAQLVSTLLQKKAQEEALRDKNVSTLESELLKVKAYGDKDKAKLSEKQKYYKNKLGDLYDQYGDNPGLMLAAMKDINREFTNDALAGDLYDIDRTYKYAMEDVKDAEEKRSEGKLLPWAYRQQIANAGTGFRAVQGDKMFDNAISRYVNTGNWANKVSEGDYNKAYNDAFAGFLSDPEVRTQIGYMNDTEKALLEQQFKSSFNSKWNANFGTGAGGDGAMTLGTPGNLTFNKLGLEKNYENVSDFSPSMFKYDDNGNVVGTNEMGNYESEKRIYRQWNNGNWAKNKAFKKWTKEEYDLTDKEYDEWVKKAEEWENLSNWEQLKRLGVSDLGSGREWKGAKWAYAEWARRNSDKMHQEAKDRIVELKKQYPELKGKTEKEIIEMYDNLISKNANEWNPVASINPRNKNFSAPSLFDEKGNINATLGKSVRVRDEKGNTKEVNTGELLESLGYNTLEEFYKQKGNKIGGKGSWYSEGAKPGTMMYEAIDSKGNTVYIESSPDSEETMLNFAPSWEMRKVVKEEDFGKHEFQYVPVAVTPVNSKGEFKDEVAAEGFEAYPDWDTGDIVYYALQKNKKTGELERIETYEDGKKDFVQLDPDKFFKDAVVSTGDRYYKNTKQAS